MLQQFQSPEIQAFAAGYPRVLLHLGVTLLIYFFGCASYALLSPHRELPLIRDGNSAAAVSLGGALLAMGIPLSTAMTASVSLVEVALWGAATLAIQLLVFRIVDFILRGLPQRIEEGDVAAAGLLVSVKLATALILAAAVAG